MKTTSSARSANKFGTTTPNRRKSGKEISIMKNFTFVFAALVVASFTAACGMDDNTEEPQAPYLEVTAQASECTAVGAPDCSKIKICWQTVVDPAEAVNPDKPHDCKPLDLSSGEADVTFSPLPATGLYKMYFEELPAGFHVKYTVGGFNTTDVISIAQGLNELKVVLGTDASNANLPGNATLKAETSDGTSVEGCAWNFAWDQLDKSDGPCEVTPAGVTCTGLPVGSYVVDVSCQDGALVAKNYQFDVLSGVTTDYTVIVAYPGSSGSGYGGLCVEVANADEADCAFFVDGKAVTPDEDADEICDGALLLNQPAKTSEVKAVCGKEEGSMTTEVAEDTVTEVSITVTSPSQPPTTGGVCFDVTKDGTAALGCSFDFDTIVVDPAPSSSPPTSCTGDGKYHFVVQAGTYQVAVTCDGASVGASVDINAGHEQYVPVTFPDTIHTNGDLCSQKMSMGVDLDTQSYDMGQWIGFGDSGSCSLATPQQLAGMSVTAISHFKGPGACTDMEDPDCVISVAGLVVSLVPDAFDGFVTDEKAYFLATVSDGNSSVDIVIVALNGYFQP